MTRSLLKLLTTFLWTLFTVKISPWENYEVKTGNDSEPALNYINKFRNLPSTKLIKSRKKEEEPLAFNYVSDEEVFNEVRNLQSEKTAQQKNVLTKILKENSEIFAKYYYENICFLLWKLNFFSDLKLANVTTSFNITSKTLKDKCKSINILANMSKIYER